MGKVTTSKRNIHMFYTNEPYEQMNEEAEKMNEANEFFRTMMDACKRLQVEQKVNGALALAD